MKQWPQHHGYLLIKYHGKYYKGSKLRALALNRIFLAIYLVVFLGFWLSDRTKTGRRRRAVISRSTGIFDFRKSGKNL